ncbi:MAG: hypothetical protein K8R48_07115 [Alphaproteobacteria bacterium]|nr:hypothetical protein [Alphaproteobacteria bacterium]
MNTAESKSIVRSAAEEDGEFLVSFFDHDGYFTVPPSAQAAELRKKILGAKKDGREIAFTYDRDLNILKVL